MASEQALAMRRAKALEDQARELAAVRRNLDLIMAHLGIVDPEHTVQEREVSLSPDQPAEPEILGKKRK